MRTVVLGVAIFLALVAIAVMEDVSFASQAANYLIVLIAMTGSVFVALVWARRIHYRVLSVSATVTLSAMYLTAMWIVGLGLAFDPWLKPDLEVRGGDLVCRAVYSGQGTEIRVFKALFFGVVHFQSDYLVEGWPKHIGCHRD
jgi:hypothetical protein